MNIAHAIPARLWRLALDQARDNPEAATAVQLAAQVAEVAAQEARHAIAIRGFDAEIDDACAELEACVFRYLVRSNPALASLISRAMIPLPEAPGAEAAG